MSNDRIRWEWGETDRYDARSLITLSFRGKVFARIYVGAHHMPGQSWFYAPGMKWAVGCSGAFHLRRMLEWAFAVAVAESFADVA